VWLRGKLIDAETGEPVAGAALGGRSFTQGEETDFRGVLTTFGDPRLPSSTEEGDFLMEFGGFLVPCGPPPPQFVRPDRIELIVVRDGCEQTFMIEINEDTVVDPSFQDDVTELIEPILVDPCEE
jgi:hypothetical protein